MAVRWSYSSLLLLAMRKAFVPDNRILVPFDANASRFFANFNNSPVTKGMMTSICFSKHISEISGINFGSPACGTCINLSGARNLPLARLFASTKVRFNPLCPSNAWIIPGPPGAPAPVSRTLKLSSNVVPQNFLRARNRSVHLVFEPEPQ